VSTDLVDLHRGVRYEERGPAVNKRSKQKRTARMIRQLRNLATGSNHRILNMPVQHQHCDFQTLWLIDDPGSEEGARHDDYRRRLSPELSDDCILMEETGECGEQELNHSDGEAEKFYRDLQQRGISVRVGWRPPAIHVGSSDC